MKINAPTFQFRLSTHLNSSQSIRSNFTFNNNNKRVNQKPFNQMSLQQGLANSILKVLLALQTNSKQAMVAASATLDLSQVAKS